MIKKLCENRSDIFKKALIKHFLTEINFHPEAQMVDEDIIQDELDALWLQSRKVFFQDWIYSSWFKEEYDLHLTKIFGGLGYADINWKHITKDMVLDYIDWVNSAPIIANLMDYWISEEELKELILFANNQKW